MKSGLDNLQARMQRQQQQQQQQNASYLVCCVGLCDWRMLVGSRIDNEAIVVDGFDGYGRCSLMIIIVVVRADCSFGLLRGKAHDGRRVTFSWTRLVLIISRRCGHRVTAIRICGCGCWQQHCGRDNVGRLLLLQYGRNARALLSFAPSPIDDHVHECSSG